MKPQDAGIKEIIIGTGYHREHYERLAELFPEVKTVFSPRFADTNSMETLYRCREAIAGRPFLLLESDIVYDISALKTLIDDPHPDIMLITPVTKFQDQYYVEADSSGNLAGCPPTSRRSHLRANSSAFTKYHQDSTKP